MMRRSRVAVRVKSPGILFVTLMSSSSAYQGRVAIVTGGASGLGAAICRELAARGAAVAIFDRNMIAAAEVAAKLQSAGFSASAFEVDVRERSQVASALESVVTRHGRLDFLFNNAGIGCWGDAREFAPDTWREVLDVNYFGCVNGSLAAYGWMAAHGGGRVVNIASLAGLVPVPGAVPYTAAKHAVVGFSLALRAEAAQFGVRVQVVCPGPIESRFHASMLRAGSMDAGRAAPAELMNADQAAHEVLRGVDRDEAVVVFPARARRTWWKWRFSSRWLNAAQRRIVNNLRRESL
jgi:NAD(P)-dependent dehydrogenase (short-subunit alcohol dehydrogenase family)